jgi:3-deoxy-D-manno-octulosonate 8-phosphate phosphatase (KDO 8-P phosphatase)
MQTIEAKALKVKCIIFDVDGILTSGQITYGLGDMELKTFHVHDGLGLKLLQNTGVKIAIITARESAIVTKRMAELGIVHVYQNAKSKRVAYDDLKATLKLEDADFAYVGDDLPDLSILNCVGLSITVADAQPIIQSRVDWVTDKKGGKGAAREICNLIMTAQGTFAAQLAKFVE